MRKLIAVTAAWALAVTAQGADAKSDWKRDRPAEELIRVGFLENRLPNLIIRVEIGHTNRSTATNELHITFACVTQKPLPDQSPGRHFGACQLAGVHRRPFAGRVGALNAVPAPAEIRKDHRGARIRTVAHHQPKALAGGANR